ncbi:hypothetical protein TWF481_001644 [Arthrobotrys musiformis]|uniref:Rhodopsin domain-containing protein n=1 Tax=Arthrobotrys musiformis TaxID=47236 RepID=A0AAV9VVW2_9PEZI
MNVLQYTACYITFFIISFAATATRAYTRKKINRGLHTEDWLTIVACSILLIQMVLSCLFTPRYTLLVDTEPTKLFAYFGNDAVRLHAFIKRTLEYQIGSHVGFLTSLWLIKFSFLFFYKRLAEGRAWSKLWIFTLAFCVLSYVGNVVGYFFVCIPLSSYFDATCASETGRSNASLYGATATDIISDLLIMAIPLRLIRHLRMSDLQKIGLACLFCLGFVVVTLSLARTIRINAGGSGAYPQSDPRWVALWSIAEEATAIVVCCLPAIRKLFNVQKERRAGTSAAIGSGSHGTRTAVETISGGRNIGKRWSLRRWSLKYGLKSMESSVNRTRTDSMVELEYGVSTVPSSPAWPLSPRKPDSLLTKARSESFDGQGGLGVIPSPPGSWRGAP